MKPNKVFRRLCTALVIVTTLVALNPAPALAESAGELQVLNGPLPGETCTPRAEVFGSYALRACMGIAPPGVIAYAYISLEEGHSRCIVRGRLVRIEGDDNAVWTRGCPGGERAGLRLYVPRLGLRGHFYSAFSIQRTSDNNIAPTAQSDWIFVTQTTSGPSTTQVTIP